MSRDQAWAFVWRKYDAKRVRSAVFDTKEEAEKEKRRLDQASYELSVWVGPVVRIPLVLSKKVRP